MSIPEQLSEIITRIHAAEKRANRPEGSVQLVAVSKTFPHTDVQICFDAGQRVFGENKVQEAMTKIPLLTKEIEWHLIGPLQRNKVRKALERFSLIHAVDSVRLALFIDTVAAELNIKPRILLEVNVGDENSKFGFSTDEITEQWSQLNALQHVDIAGLMCIPPPVENPEDARPYFKKLRELRDTFKTQSTTHSLTELSMGMSHDFEIAIEEGATLVRVGTAIFGGRTYAI